MPETRILVAIDDSPASKRAVAYVAKLAGRRRRFRFCMVHVLPPLPPGLLEYGGSADPSKEAEVELEFKAEQQRWISAAKKAAEKALNDARTTLRKAGVSAGAIETLFCEPAEGRDAAESVLQMARECKCCTVVAGRQSVSWFHELFSRELPEELLRHGKGFSVWVIE